jgi:hypothetical protein
VEDSDVFPELCAVAVEHVGSTVILGLSAKPIIDIAKMPLLNLSFGKVPLRSNDEVRKERSASCKEVFREQPNEILERRRSEKNGKCFVEALRWATQIGRVPCFTLRRL